MKITWNNRADHSAVLNEIPAEIRVILNAFLTILADQSADCAVLCLVWQGIRLRNRCFDWLKWSKLNFENTRIAPGVSFNGYR
jgi:hypothetical protein